MKPKNNSFGNHIKTLREEAKETLADVSSAIEIEIEHLEKIETGQIIPDDNLVMMFISHFGLLEKDAMKLWLLAENKSNLVSPQKQNVPEPKELLKAPVDFGDIKTVYTDMVHININGYGVVINFMQGSGFNNQYAAIARVGMSREHAKNLLEVLQRTLMISEMQNSPKTEETK